MGNKFPDDFLWGAATAAYQAEGGITNNDWDFFTSNPVIHDRVKKLGTFATPPENFELKPAGEAVQHADLGMLKQDLDRCRLLGMNAYRFSVEWSRLEPRPQARTNVLEDYYVPLVRELRVRKMVPVVTLNHLSLPQWVLTPPDENKWLVSLAVPAAAESDAFRQSLRGWENPATVEAFIAYLKYVVARLTDEGVRFWIPLNEPVGSMVVLGYLAGAWPPGFTGEKGRAKAAYFNILRAHVRAYDAIKAIAPEAQVGVAHNIFFCKKSSAPEPAFGSHGEARNQIDYFYHFHFLNSVIQGNVDVAIEHQTSKQQFVFSEEFFGIPPGQWRPKLDFIGVNYYRAAYARHDPLAALFAGGFTGGVVDTNEPENGALRNALGWEIFPEGFYQILITLHAMYGAPHGLPLLVTENGIAEGSDANRAAYIVSHLHQVLRARADGARILGYLHWTIVDNFEWNYNYEPRARFGLFSVDRETRDQDRHFPRHLTEGALALQCVIAEGDLDQAAANFGAMGSGGTMLFAPDKSPGGAWDAKSGDGSEFALYFNQLAGGRLIGMIFYHGPNAWLRLDQIEWRGAERRLVFAHGAQSGVAARRYEALARGHDFDGTATEGGRVISWLAAKNPLFGVWRRTGVDQHLFFWNLEGAFGGKRGKIKFGRTSGWHPMNFVEGGDNQVKLILGALPMGGFRGIDATVKEGRLIGQTFPAPSAAFEASRLPDGLPFG